MTEPRINRVLERRAVAKALTIEQRMEAVEAALDALPAAVAAEVLAKAPAFAAAQAKRQAAAAAVRPRAGRKL